MSKYTTSIRNIIDSLTGNSEQSTADNFNSRILTACPLIFLPFPLFNEDYRLTLESKILKHYYTREIAFETFGLWKIKLDTRMNEIMPYYNKLYYSAELTFDPLHDVDLTRINSGTSESGQNTQSTSRATNTQHGTNQDINKYSETPSGALVNVISGQYLTNANVDDSTSTNTGESESEASGSDHATNLTEFSEHITGKQGGKTFPEMIKDYRDALINVDLQVIEALSDLFFTMY